MRSSYNCSMPSAYRLVFLIPLVFIAADAIVFRALNQDSHPGATQQVWLAGFVHAQVGLLWIWAPLGTMRRVIRWTGAIGGTIALAGLASWAYHDLDEMRAIALAFFGITAVALELTLGRMKFKLVNPRTVAVDSTATGPIQFSLRDLLAVTTASAVLVFFTKQFLLPIRINCDVAAEILQEVPLAILFSILAMSSILVVFGSRLRLIACFLFAFCVWLPGFWSEHIPCAGSPTHNRPVVILTTAIIVGCLAFCRWCGTRVSRRGPVRQPFADSRIEGLNWPDGATQCA